MHADEKARRFLPTLPVGRMLSTCVVCCVRGDGVCVYSCLARRRATRASAVSIVLLIARPRERAQRTVATSVAQLFHGPMRRL